MVPIDRAESLVHTTNQRCVTSQMNEDLSYIAAET